MLMKFLPVEADKDENYLVTSSDENYYSNVIVVGQTK